MPAPRIVLFYPHVGAGAIQNVTNTLKSRWIGQGPQVDEFERRFSAYLGEQEPGVAVSSGTAALHLAYILAGIGDGDEVVTPVFTCTATNIPLLYQRAKPVFADVCPRTLDIDVEHVRTLVNSRTRALVCVHYGGLPCDMSALREIADEWGIPVIEDAAHALGASYHGRAIGTISEFTAFSFQAVKHLTSGDGGMLMMKDGGHRSRARKIRWFGIDRAKKLGGAWANDIEDVGFKYQMTDIEASIGLAGLPELDSVLALRRALFRKYREALAGIAGLEVLGAESSETDHAAWACTVLVESRVELQRKLLEHNIESDQVHYRNDRYSIFGGRRADLPNMDTIEDKYLVLPLHTKMTEADVERICDVIRSGW